MTTSPQPIKVRDAVLEDAQAIVDIGRHVFRTTFGHSCTQKQMDNYLDEAYTIPAITKDIEDPMKHMIVATNAVDGSVMGFGTLTQGTSEPCVAHLEDLVELQRLYVDLSCHRQGVGKLLIQQMENMARGMGFRNIWLGVWEHNHKAQAVYTKAGYKLVGQHDFDVGGDIQTDQMMAKAL